MPVDNKWLHSHILFAVFTLDGAVARFQLYSDWDASSVHAAAAGFQE
jgi:hypothetical protein